MNEAKLLKNAHWVRSKQANEISGFNRMPVPAHFATLREAEVYRRKLNSVRGPYHPGYIVEENRMIVHPPFLLESERPSHPGISTRPTSGEDMSLTVMSRIVSGIVIVDISGRLCVLENGLREHMNELLEEGHRNFILNLKDVPYIDSFGLGQLIIIWTSVRSRGGELILLRPTDHVQTPFHITKLNGIFHISGEEGEAIRTARRFTVGGVAVNSSLP